MNIPYVKQFDDNGQLLNPITEYFSEFPNRQQRHAERNQPNFRGNTKHINLTVNGVTKFKRDVQIVFDKTTKKRKTILHYNLQ